MRVWRIAPDTPEYGADDRSGAGAKHTGGRWNRQGLPVLYCADKPALACLETLVHLGASRLPLHRYLVALEIPDPVWAVREIRSPSALPAGWDARPFGQVSLDLGEEWLKSNETAVMEVPSAIVPEDSVLLINPQHPDSRRITASKTRPWTHDARLV